LVFDSGQREQVAQGVAVVMGRGPSPQVEGDQLLVVTDGERTLSKSHLRLEHTSGGVWVTDLGSTNGTELLEDEGPPQKLATGARTRLEDSVRVRMGHRTVSVSRVQGR
jgi:pSer/pThr/pTyr-binding forkhead associated (FHA) protein